jgi:hypothetical protein
MTSMGIPFADWSRRVQIEGIGEAGGRPTLANAAKTASLISDTRNLSALIYANVYCDYCKRCFTERKKLTAHMKICRKKISLASKVSPESESKMSKDADESSKSMSESLISNSVVVDNEDLNLLF